MIILHYWCLFIFLFRMSVGVSILEFITLLEEVDFKILSAQTLFECDFVFLREILLR